VNSIVRRYAGLSVPRYTSYPTAADFTAGVTAKEHASWLRRLDAKDDVSVYLHVPYCREICLYCGCNTKKAARDDVVDAYRRALETEIEMVGGLLAEPPGVSRLHWGGGTPSILGPDGLRSVVTVLRRVFPFKAGFEHAIELDPRHVTVELTNELAELGITRASLGVQDVNPLVQAAIGRLQPLAVIEAAVARVSGAGIHNLNFDLIYGLPLQTTESIRKTCAHVVSMEPDRIACFGYAHLPRLKANQRRIDESKLPSQDERIEQADAMAEALVAAGYERIGIDHFAKPGDSLARAAASGRLHRNFQGYTADQCRTLIGFGASAVGTLPGAYIQNTTQVGEYRRRIEAGSFAIQRARRLSEDDVQRRDVIERLMCEFAVDLDTVTERHGLAADHFEPELARLSALESQGILRVEGRRITLDESCWPLARSVAAIFDSYLKPEEQRHAAAI